MVEDIRYGFLFFVYMWLLGMCQLSFYIGEFVSKNG